MENKHPLTKPANCVFCDIIADRSPTRVRYLDEEIIVIVNKLTWVPLMLLVMPKKHMGQSEMWSSGLMSRLGSVAVDMDGGLLPRDSAFCPTSAETDCKAKAMAIYM